MRELEERGKRQKGENKIEVSNHHTRLVVFILAISDRLRQKRREGQTHYPTRQDRKESITERWQVVVHRQKQEECYRPQQSSENGGRKGIVLRTGQPTEHKE